MRYTDAFESVEAANTIGMSQLADGGIVASKPYVASGVDIDRMSECCGDCAYRVKDRSSPNAGPFSLLYCHASLRPVCRQSAHGTDVPDLEQAA